MSEWITSFEHPAFLWAGAAVLPLLALYWFFRRSNVTRVSAIFLWERPETTPESGARWQLRRLPLSFFLEALALLLLAFAAASPFRMAREAYPVLAVVLDNSYSMRAAPPGGVSPRERGAEELRKRLARHPGRRVLLILAGNEPRLCSDTREENPDFEKFWTADEPAADLAGALALARMRSAGCELLVLTDRRPDFPLAEDTGCFAAGTPLGNTALVNVRRGAETILAEALNASSRPRRVQLELNPGGTAGTVELSPGERYKFVCRIPDSALAREISVTLRTEEGDPLPFDNRVVLLPESREPVRYAVAADLPEPAVRELDAVLAGNPDFVRSDDPELVFGGPGLAAGNHHRFLWNTGRAGQGSWSREPISARPDRALTRGLALRDLRWSADPQLRLPGEVLLRRGETPLLSFRRRIDDRSDLFLNLDPERSNLSRRPFWPAFFWNVAEYLRAERPGPGLHNFRSGDLIAFRIADPAVREVRVICPDGSERSVVPFRRRVLLADLPPGVSRIEAGEEAWSVSVLPLSAVESQLEGAGVFRCEPGRVAQMAENPRTPLGWIALLLAAAVLALHQCLLGRKREEAAK